MPSAAVGVNTTAAELGLPEYQRITIHGVLALHESVLMLWGRQRQLAWQQTEYTDARSRIRGATRSHHACSLRER